MSVDDDADNDQWTDRLLDKEEAKLKIYFRRNCLASSYQSQISNVDLVVVLFFKV